MFLRKLVISFMIVCCLSNAFSQESGVNIQIREPQKLVSQIEKYVLGNGLHTKESNAFFSPIQKAFLTTLQSLEPLIGVKIETILTLFNGNIDLIVNPDEKVFRVRVDYPTKEIASSSANIIKTFFGSKAGIMLAEKTEGEMTTYSDEVNGSFYMSLKNNSLYIQAGNFIDDEGNNKKISFAIPPLTKSKSGANLSFQITPQLMQKSLENEKLLSALYGQGLNYTLSFAENYIEVNSEMKIAKSDFIQSIIPKTPISEQGYKLISQNTSFAIATKFNFSQFLQNLNLLKEFPEAKDVPQYIEIAKQGFTKFTKLDLQKDLLAHMGEEIIISVIPEEEAGGNPVLSMLNLNSIYFAFPLKNTSAFEISLNKLLTSLSQLAQATPFSTIGDGVQTISLEGAKIYYIKFAQGILTPCFMIKENVLFVSTNVVTLDYINKNCKTWGSLSESKEFQSKVPTKNATLIYYDKYTGNPNRPNYLAHLTSTAAFGTLIFCNYMGNEKINPSISGEPFRQASFLIKPIVAAIDFTQYPASKNFKVPYGDNYSYWTFENNTLYFNDKSGHILNGSTGIMPVVAATAIIATVAVPQLLEARRHSNERAAIGTLRSFNTDQETYKADNNTYGTIQQLNASGKINLTQTKAGYVYKEIIKSPNADFYAVIASPATWGSSGRKHFIITSDGTVRECSTLILPFELSLDASQKTIDVINKLPEAR